MTIELTMLISVLSFLLAVYIGVANMKRNQRHDTKTESANLTTVIVKLESISTNIAELKTETKGVKDEIKDLRDRLIRTETSNTQLDKRLSSVESEVKRLRHCVPQEKEK